MDTSQFISMLSSMPQPPKAPRRFQKGGRMVGPGSGTSDSIPAAIIPSDGSQDFTPALLSEGEFVVRADVVSALGGGATDPGVAVLESLVNMVLKMDREQADTFARVIVTAGEQILSLPTKAK